MGVARGSQMRWKLRQDIAHRIAQRDGTPVRAAHRATGGGESAQQPLHFGRVEPHIDLDRGAAGNRRRESAPQIVERGFAQSPSAISRISNTSFSTSAAPTPAGAAFTAMVRLPKGSVSKPERSSSSAMRAYSICCAAVSWSTRGISNRCRSTVPAACWRSTFSNRIRSWATCWSIIHSPSRPAAMMKLS